MIEIEVDRRVDELPEPLVSASPRLGLPTMFVRSEFPVDVSELIDTSARVPHAINNYKKRVALSKDFSTENKALDVTFKGQT